MQEIKDPTIKLFGQKIPFQNQQDRHVVCEFNDEEEKQQLDKDPPANEVTQKKKEADPPPNAAETKNNKKDSGTSPEPIQNPKTPSIEEETVKSKNEKSENDQSDDANNDNSQQAKPLMKPDKLLPCPRCNSMDTKFCYYNNYNVNQPRYFCKACQRYWTAGGTMRNVPVGAGRRKNKNSATSHYRHITISEALQAARIDSPNGTHLSALKTNGRVLSFGVDPPIYDSVTSVLNLAEEKVVSNVAQNGFHGLEDQRISSIPCKSGKNGDDSSSISSITVSNSMEETGKTASQEPIVQSNGFLPPQVPCIPWLYPWNSAVPSPALCPPGYPISFYRAAFWNCSVPGNWNIPWYPTHPFVPNTKAPNSNPNSPTLGKHSRDDNAERDYPQKEEPPRQRNGCVLVPKTLRIDDPSEAAKSSIWATLGIKNESIGKGGMFKAFQSKKEDQKKNHVVEASPVLRANPAAMSRSLNFHENS